MGWDLGPWIGEFRRARSGLVSSIGGGRNLIQKPNPTSRPPPEAMLCQGSAGMALPKPHVTASPEASRAASLVPRAFPQGRQ